MANIRRIVGQNIRRLREQSDKNRSELCREIGMSRSYWDAVEAGVKEPSITTLDRMASALGVALGEIVKHEIDGRPPRKPSRK